MSKERIPFPLGGVSDNWAAQDQEIATTPNAVNMRSLDPVSGRKRGAQRSGTAKFIAAAAGSSFVQDIISINKDVRLATYAEHVGAPDAEWEREDAVDVSIFVKDMVMTPGGDIWIIKGSDIIAKYNATGKLILEEKIVLTDSGESLQCLALGSDGGLFVSTESVEDLGDGTTRSTGRILRYESDPLDETMVVKIYSFDLGGGSPSIVWDNNYLYCICNKRSESELVSLDNLTSDVPLVEYRKSIPYPSTHVAVNHDGEILVSSEPRVGRDVVTAASFCGIKSDVSPFWTPNDLGIGELRSWHRASDLVDYADNEIVDFWFDQSGNSRNIWAASEGEGPVGNGGSKATFGGRFVDDAVCGMPGIRFGLETDVNDLHPGFTSGAGSSSLFPPDNTPFFISMIFVSRDQGNDSSDSDAWGKIVERGGQPYHALIQSTTGKFFHGEFTDPNPLDNTDGGAGGTNQEIDGTTTGPLPASLNPVPESRVGGMSITNIGNVCILTVAYDPNIDPEEGSSTAADNALEGSFFRVNGKHGGAYTNQFTLGDLASSDATRIGYSVWGDQFANMDLCEMVVVEMDYQWPSDYERNGYPMGGGTPANWPGEPAADPAAQVSEIEMVEGYLAHRHGLQSFLAATHPYVSTAPVGGTGEVAAPTANPYIGVLTSPDGIVSKFSSAGDLVWALSGDGLGYSSVSDEDGGVYCTGKKISSPGPTDKSIRKIYDDGFAPSEDSGDGAWIYSGLFTSPSVRMGIDSEKNLYVPCYDDDGDGIGGGLAKFDVDGTLDWVFGNSSGQGGEGLCCAIDSIESDFNDDTIGEPEFIYYGTAFLSENSFYKLRLVDVTVTDGAPRENVHLVVCEGNIKKIDRVAGTVTTVTDGAGALNASSRIVMSSISDGKVFYTDGEQYKVYDPDTDTVKAWESSGSGSLPKRGKINVEWRTRMLVARVEGEPQNIYMSELGNPLGWNLFPNPLTSTSALALAASDAGPVPDTVNALIPYSDDILIIGGDHSIHMLRGDPLAGQLDPARGTFSSGQISLMSDSTGMAFGRSWCKDESGYVYFYGSRGGVYRMIPGQPPQKISDEIDLRLKSLDLSKYTVRLVWNERDRGFHLYIVPLTTETDAVTHWFWYRKDGSWWSDEFPVHTSDPTAIAVADGDEPDDRVILIGCKDGYVRFIDKDSSNDDGAAIDANVMIGPLNPKSVHDNARFTSFRFSLASDQDGAVANLYKTEEADDIGSVVATKNLVAGKNRSWNKKIKGKAVFIELKNDTIDERFAVESIGVSVAGAGRVK